jgi:SAM-dependent methyltransferase
MVRVLETTAVEEYAMDWSEIWKSDLGDSLSAGPATRSRLRLMRDLVADHAVPGGSLLDVGCGKGELLAAIAELKSFSRLVGVDVSAVPLERARRVAPRAELHVLDVCEAALPEQFDVITCMMTLDLVPDEERAAASLAAMLKPGGHLLVVVQHDKKHASPLDVRYGVRRHDSGSLTALLREQGLEPVEVFSWGYPLFNSYYRLLNAGATDSVGTSAVRSRLFRAASAGLVQLFRVDDWFKRSGKGRVLFGVFRKR